MKDALAARCFLTGLHIVISLTAGVSMVTLLLQWTETLECLPPFVNAYGDPVTLKTFPPGVCNVITYGTCIICSLNLAQALTFNCCWQSLGCMVTHQGMAILTCLFSGCCGSALTVVSMLWCSSLQSSPQDTMSFDSCENAASSYDNFHSSSNMTTYLRKLEIQQACNWAITSLAFIAVVVYTFVTCRLFLSDRNTSPPPGSRYYLLQSEELTPLLSSHDDVSLVRRSALTSISSRVGGGQRDPPNTEAIADRPITSPVAVPTLDRPVSNTGTTSTESRTTYDLA